MPLEVLMSIVGAFISLLLIVNAFFTRLTLEKITSIELKLAVLISNHDATEEGRKQNARDIREIKEKYHDKINEIGSMVAYNKIEIEQLKALLKGNNQ